MAGTSPAMTGLPSVLDCPLSRAMTTESFAGNDDYARIQVEMSGPSRDCLIVNMSEEGVRRHSEIPELPNEFTLVIADAEHPRRTCRVAWRLGFEIGAKFTDLDRLAARRPSACAVLA